MKIKGYTLIELLFVIAIIAMIASVAIIALRNKAQDLRINKAAAQIQQVLTAGLSYYVDNNKWPENHSDGSCATQASSEQSFIQNYLPNETETNLFGTYYCWGASTSKKKFWVAVQLPQQNDSTKTAEFGKRIVARLPNAVITSTLTSGGAAENTCTNNTCYVHAEVGEPGYGSSGAKSSADVAAAGDCYPSGFSGPKQKNEGNECVNTVNSDTEQYRVTFPACSSNQTPRVSAAPNFLQMPEKNPRIKNFAAFEQTCTSTPDQNGNENCDITVKVTECWGSSCSKEKNIVSEGGSVGASYTVTCMKNKSNLVGVGG